jgi:hypothetical protein
MSFPACNKRGVPENRNRKVTKTDVSKYNTDSSVNKNGIGEKFPSFSFTILSRGASAAWRSQKRIEMRLPQALRGFAMTVCCEFFIVSKYSG